MGVILGLPFSVLIGVLAGSVIGVCIILIPLLYGADVIQRFLSRIWTRLR